MKITKRILSFFLSALMIVTSIPAFAITSSAAEAVRDKYLFAYFTGNGDVTSTSSENQAIRFAVTADNKNFTVLNSGNPVIKQSKGALNCRDPYIFLGQDGWFYIIATDMKAVSYWGDSKSFVFWRSKDLINWQNETIIDISTMLGTNVQRAWAPQVIWDEAKGEYMVYFGLAADGYAKFATGNNTHMYYMHTSDLLDASKYSTPKPLIETEYTASSSDSIDGDITYADGKYFLFYKEEGAGTICVATSTSITGPYTNKIVLQDSSVGALEGCQVYQDNDGNYIFMADLYGNNGTFVVYNLGQSLNTTFAGNPSTLDIQGFKITDSNINNCGPRHGSMLKITTEQYNALLGASSFNTIASASGSGMTSVVGDDIEENNGIDLSSNLLARYFVYDTTTDENSGTYNLTASGSGAQWHDEASAGLGAAYFTPDNYLYTNAISQMFNSVSAEAGITVSFYGNPESSCDAKGRFFELNDKGIKESISWDGNPYNQNNTSYVTMWHSANLEATNNDYNGRVWTDAGEINDEWHQYTVTMNSSQFVVYRDGVQLSSTDSNLFSGILTSLQSTGYLTIGATCWPDPTYTGYMRDFRIYNKAVSADEAKKLYNQYGYDNTYDLEKLKALMAECEAKFANVSSTGVIYANMADAYNAYVNANKFYDAYYYGQQLELADQAEEYAKALDKALNNMVEWTPYTGTAVGSFADDYVQDVAQKSEYYKNILYTEPVSDWNNYNSSSYSENALYYSNTVMLYDGITAPQTGMLLWSKKLYSGGVFGKTRKIYAANLTNPELSFIGNWKGSTNNRDFMWLMQTQPYEIGLSASDQLLLQIGSGTGASSVVYSANVMKFSGAFSANEYAKTVYPSLYCQWTSDSIKDDINFTVNGNNAIYIINYKAVIDSVNTVKSSYSSYLSNVSTYKQGGLADLLAKIDGLTSVNPNSYNYASDIAGQVQACATAIQNAVNSVNTVSTPVADGAGYQAFRDAFDANINHYNDYISNGNYTQISKDQYVALCAKGMELMRNVLTSGYNDNDNISAVATAISTDPTQTVLNPKVDTSALQVAISQAETKSIFDGVTQKYTLQSWIDIKNEVDLAKSMVTDYAENGKYASQSLTAAGVAYNKIDVNTPSEEQSAINTSTNKLTTMELKEIDSAILQNFDAAYEVAVTIPKTAYDADARQQAMDKIEEIRNTVYTSPENASASYGCTVPEGFEGEIVIDVNDDKTTQILDIVAELENYLATFKITMHDEGVVAEPQTMEYGEELTLTVHDEPGVWTISTPAGDSTIYVPAGEEAVVTVESEMDAVFTSSVEEELATDKVTVLDVFGRTVSVFYINSDRELTDEVIESHTQAKIIPFYTFEKWNITSNADGEYTVRPIYTFVGADGMFTVKVNGEELGEFEYDSPVTVTDNSGKTPYAWVNRTTDGMYQIVSYSASYKFYACSDGDYYPVYAHDDGYYYVNDTEKLTAEKVENVMPYEQKVGMTPDEHLNFKLKKQYPFIYVEGTRVIDMATGQFRVYARFTEGATKYEAFGVNVKYNENNYKFNCSNKTSSNQFMFTVTIKGATKQDKIVFMPYINHWFVYEDTRIDAYYVDSEQLLFN